MNSRFSKIAEKRSENHLNRLSKMSQIPPATVHKVRTSFEVISRDHKKLLLPAQIAVHGLSICANAQGLQRGAMQG